MMLKIGITGGIGSGKTLVSTLFSLLEIPVFNSDLEARLLMNEDPEIRAGLVSLFGPSVLSADGRPDRRQIASRVFEHPEDLEALNALIHPAVFKSFDHWLEALAGKAPYVIKEAAIMFESGSYLQNDLNITVFSDLKTRIERIQSRDHLSVTEIMARMHKQLSEEEKMNRSDFIIFNDEQHSLIEQVMGLDGIFRQKQGRSGS